MTISEAAKKWNVSEKTVFSYILKEYIPNLRLENNILLLPELKKPYIPNRKLKNVRDYEKAIIRALEKDYFINDKIVGVDLQTFSDRLKALESTKQIIARTEKEIDYSSNRDFYLNSNRNKSINLNISPTIKIQVADKMGLINS